MRPKERTAISPTREENYPEWYQSVVQAAELAEHSPVRGCMVIKPWGYGIWENIQRALDDQFKRRGVQNCYFPLFIPLSFFKKEAAHIEGFAKECAVVTHHRLEKNEKGELVPSGELEEPLIIRPTSEMIIGDSFSRWIESYRDLPLKINQWCNVVRWEMRTRLFLRTAEFLWQEGHTAHETKQEAEEMAKEMLHVYSTFAKEVLAIPSIPGEKTESERFPGAVHTYTFEAMMQDRKAIQCGTSHFLGQNFAKASSIQFQGRSGEREYAWTTSWGATTRLIGGLIMTHSDDDGLILPPREAPKHLVIIPILQNVEAKNGVLKEIDRLKEALGQCVYHGRPLEIVVDERDLRGGEKAWGWIKKGIPLRLEVGMKEVESKKFKLLRRDHAHKEGTFLTEGELQEKIPLILDEIQKTLLERASRFQEKHTQKIDHKDEFFSFFKGKEDEIFGGFALTHWNRDPKVEAEIKQKLNVTIRCIPFDISSDAGVCPFTGGMSPGRVLFARAY